MYICTEEMNGNQLNILNGTQHISISQARGVFSVHLLEHVPMMASFSSQVRVFSYSIRYGNHSYFQWELYLVPWSETKCNYIVLFLHMQFQKLSQKLVQLKLDQPDPLQLAMAMEPC